MAQLPYYSIGIVVDQSSKYVKRFPLPSKINHNDFRKLKGKSAVYEYGKHLYEIKLHELSDLNVSETDINGVSLYDDIISKYKDVPKSSLVADLKPECAVLVYRNNRDEARNMPSAMCRLSVDTREVKDAHIYSIMPPYKKRLDINAIVNRFFRGLSFNSVKLQISRDMHVPIFQELPFPVLQFGNNRTLDINHLARRKDFGKQKETLLLSPEAGFYERKPLGQQYLLLPKSVYETWGDKFISDLCGTFNHIYKEQYSPKIIPYDDSKKSVPHLSKSILNAINANGATSGYCLVMIHRFKKSNLNKEDYLANTVIRKLAEMKLNASVIHTSVSEDSILQKTDNNGNRTWDVIHKMRGRYKGYLKNVVMNKILLLNDIRPFTLKERLNSDVVIGIDRKSNHAGFVFVTSHGESIYFTPHKTKRNEKLRPGLIKTAISSYLKDIYAIVASNLPKNILIHRDGALFDEEIAAIKQTIDDLKIENVVHKDCQCTFVEIRKTHMLPLRIFNVSPNDGSNSEYVSNPNIGTTFLNDNDAFMTTTGKPYHLNGTSNPLLVSYKGGGLSFQDALSDTFALTHLTWTKIDYCSRIPITIRFGDIGLRDVAGEYDEDDIEYGIEEGGA